VFGIRFVLIFHELISDINRFIQSNNNDHHYCHYNDVNPRLDDDMNDYDNHIDDIAFGDIFRYDE
jgi:hypothetical protein